MDSLILSFLITSCRPTYLPAWLLIIDFKYRILWDQFLAYVCFFMIIQRSQTLRGHYTHTCQVNIHTWMRTCTHMHIYS